jgi:hypothetical protein
MFVGLDIMKQHSIKLLKTNTKGKITVLDAGGYAKM